MKSIRIFFYFGFLTLLASSANLQARSDEVDSDQRLGLLQRATGSGSNGSAFQARLDAVYNTSGTDPARATVAQEDSLVRQAQVAAQEKLLADEKLAEEKKSLENPDPFYKKDRLLIKGAGQSGKIESSEASYQKDLEKIRLENEKRNQEQNTQAPKPQQSATENAEKNPMEKNPFYVPQTETPATNRKFEESKTVIISRLVQKGLTEDRAFDMVADVSSEDELVLKLMQAEDMSFGDASELASTSSEESNS